MPRQRHLLIEKAVSSAASYVPGRHASKREEDPHTVAEHAVEVYNAIQKPQELGEMVEMLRKAPPRRVLEIGTGRGGSLAAWCEAARESAVLVSVDLPEGPFGGGYRLRDEFRFTRKFSLGEQRIICIRGDSHAEAIQRRVRRAFGNNPVDFLFLDGDHSYAGVADDFLRYAAMVRPGGMIAFHDIVHHSPENSGDVARFWREIPHWFPKKEIVSPGEARDGRGWGGIGVLWVPQTSTV